MTISSGTSQTVTFPPVTTLVVDAASGGSQHAVRTLRDSSGDGEQSETVLAYMSDGVHLASLKVTTTFTGINDVRQWTPSPAPLLIPAGAQAGQREHFSMTGSGITADVTVNVHGPASVTVAGSAVKTLAVSIASSFSGSVSGWETDDLWVMPDTDLSVKEHVGSDVRDGLYERTSNYDATLQRLTPS